MQIYSLVLGQKRKQSLSQIRRLKRKGKKEEIPKRFRKLILNNMYSCINLVNVKIVFLFKLHT